MQPAGNPILLVEDDDAEAAVFTNVLKELRVTNELIRKTKGREVLAYMMNSGGKKPCMILLNLHTADQSGMSFLTTACKQKLLGTIPIVILTTPECAEHDVARCSTMGVIAYIVKPADCRKFVDAVKAVGLYWTPREATGRR